MSKARLLLGLAREANRFVGRFTGRRSGQYADRPAGKVKKFIRRQSDLMRRPGRAHGYETPKLKPPRTRAQGHAVYKKSLGVPGFKTRAHHEFLALQAENRTGALLAGAGISAHGLMETHTINKKTSALKKRSGALDRNTQAIKNAQRKSPAAQRKSPAASPSAKRSTSKAPSRGEAAMAALRMPQAIRAIQSRPGRH
jgi:hypothetical protein